MGETRIMIVLSQLKKTVPTKKSELNGADKQRWMCRKIDFKLIARLCVGTNNNNDTPSEIESTRLNCQMESKFIRPTSKQKQKPIPRFVFSIIIKYKLNGIKWQFHFINFDFISMLSLHMSTSMSTKLHYLVISKRKLL